MLMTINAILFVKLIQEVDHLEKICLIILEGIKVVAVI